MGKKLHSGKKMGNEYELGKSYVAKYLWTAMLSEPHLKLLDESVISMAAVYDVSFVEDMEKQEIIAELLQSGEYKLDMRKASLIHDYVKCGTLTEKRIRHVIVDGNTNKPKSSSPKPIRIKPAVIRKYFPGETNRKKIEDTIEKALDMYFASIGEDGVGD